MSIFGSLSTDGIEEVGDRLGGGFQLFDSGLYESATVKMAYAGKSNTAGSQAASLTVLYDIGGKEFRETYWVTNKEGQNFKTNDAGKKEMQAGYAQMDELSLILTGKPLNQQPSEEKLVKIFNYEQKKDIPESRHTMSDWEGKTVTLGILRTMENKQKKDDKGNYVDTPETREKNSVHKFFDPESGLTVPEAKAGQTEPKFRDSWVKKYQGVTQDRRRIKDGGQAGSAGAPPAGDAAPRQSLFGNKS